MFRKILIHDGAVIEETPIIRDEKRKAALVMRDNGKLEWWIFDGISFKRGKSAFGGPLDIRIDQIDIIDEDMEEAFLYVPPFVWRVEVPASQRMYDLNDVFSALLDHDVPLPDADRIRQVEATVVSPSTWRYASGSYVKIDDRLYFTPRLPGLLADAGPASRKKAFRAEQWEAVLFGRRHLRKGQFLSRVPNHDADTIIRKGSYIPAGDNIAIVEYEGDLVASMAMEEGMFLNARYNGQAVYLTKSEEPYLVPDDGRYTMEFHSVESWPNGTLRLHRFRTDSGDYLIEGAPLVEALKRVTFDIIEVDETVTTTDGLMFRVNDMFIDARLTVDKGLRAAYYEYRHPQTWKQEHAYSDALDQAIVLATEAVRLARHYGSVELGPGEDGFAAMPSMPNAILYIRDMPYLDDDEFEQALVPIIANAIFKYRKDKKQ